MADILNQEYLHVVSLGCAWACVCVCVFAWASAILFSVFSREMLERLEPQEPLEKRDSWVQRYVLDSALYRNCSIKNIVLVVQGDRGFDGLAGPKGTQGEKGERVRQ